MNERLEELLADAEKGDAMACCELGEMYQSGDGVSKDLSKGFEYFKKGAENVYTFEGWVQKLYCELAECYDKGLGTETDPAKAFEYYSAAMIREDLIETELDLKMYINVAQRMLAGYGCERNVKEALGLLETVIMKSESIDPWDEDDLEELVTKAVFLRKCGTNAVKNPTAQAELDTLSKDFPF